MRFNSGGMKDAAAVELPTAHISHLQQGSGPQLSRRRPKLEALGGFISQLWISALQDLSARLHLPFGGWGALTAVPLEAPSGREVMKGDTRNIIFLF